MIKPAIDRQNWETGGEVGFTVSCEAVIFVKFVVCFDVGGGAKIDVLDTARPGFFKQMVEKFFGNANVLIPIIRGNKPVLQSRLILGDIE